MTAAHSRQRGQRGGVAAPVVVAAVVADLGRDPPATRSSGWWWPSAASGPRRQGAGGREPQERAVRVEEYGPAPRPAGRREDTGRVR